MIGISFTQDMLRMVLTCKKCGDISYHPKCKCGSSEFVKTMTRRIINPKPPKDIHLDLLRINYKCRYGKKGDKLYIKEALMRSQSGLVTYAFDGLPVMINGESQEWKWKPKKLGAMYMPEIAARFHIENNGVTPQKIQDITEEDAVREGILDGGCTNCGNSSYPSPCGCDNPTPDFRDAFIYLWNSINEKRGYSWMRNNWVWAINFKRIQ